MRSYTVTEFTVELQSIMKGAYDDVIAITGEVSGVSRSTAGHIYFDLKDNASRIRVAYFKNYNSQRTAVMPKNGDSVDVMGNIDLYAADGSYSLKAMRIVYKSEGELYLTFIEVKNRLEEKGYFDEARKKPIPSFPKCVALVTSMGAAALKDFLIATKRLNAAYDIEIFPASVQGVEAKAEIITALKNIEMFKERYDVIVITRGGGSAEDLAIFNDEELALTAANMSIPLISAIGHERDFTILDFVSDKRAATPTAAANMLAENYLLLASTITESKRKLFQIMRVAIERNSYRLDILEKRLDASSIDKKLERLKYKITIFTNKIRSYTLRRLSLSLEDLNRLERLLLKSSPTLKLHSFKAKVESLYGRLIVAKNSKIATATAKIDIVKNRLELLDPFNVLNRGYAIVTKGGKVLSDSSGVAKGDSIDIRLKSSEINCNVLSYNVIDSKVFGGQKV